MSPAWRAAIVSIGLLWLLIGIAYRETLIVMVGIWWRSDTFNHCFLVPPLALWLIWRSRPQLLARPPRPAPAVLVALLACGIAWLAGQLVAVNSVTQLAVVCMLILSVVAVIGWRASATIAFPLAYLLFAVPIGEFLMPMLMQWTADFTVAALRASGIPVYREGLQFVIPSGRWSVVEACSGVRYLIASVSVGVVFGYLNYHSLKRRLLFAVVAVLVPILANWARAYMIVMLGHLSGNTLAVGVDHLVYGWLFFGVVILLMFAVGARWAEPDTASATAGEAEGNGRQGQAATVGQPLIALVVAVFLMLPVAAELALQREGARGESVSLAPPTTLGGGWALDASAGAPLQPSFQNPSATLLRVFARPDGARVSLYVGYYRNQSQARKLVSSDNTLVPSSDTDWQVIRTAGHDAVIGADTVGVQVTDLRASGRGRALAGPWTAWRLYWINGALTGNDYRAKLIGAFQRLTGRPDESAVVIASAADGPDHRADATIADFMKQAWPAVDALLHATARRP